MRATSGRRRLFPQSHRGLRRPSKPRLDPDLCEGGGGSPPRGRLGHRGGSSMKPRWNGFHSPLANGIQQFLAHKRALGQSYGTEEKALRLFDAFLGQQKVQNVGEVTQELVAAFMASRPRSPPRSYRSEERRVGKE